MTAVIQLGYGQCSARIAEHNRELAIVSPMTQARRAARGSYMQTLGLSEALRPGSRVMPPCVADSHMRSLSPVIACPFECPYHSKGSKPQARSRSAGTRG